MFFEHDKLNFFHITPLPSSSDSKLNPDIAFESVRYSKSAVKVPWIAQQHNDWQVLQIQKILCRFNSWFCIQPIKKWDKKSRPCMWHQNSLKTCQLSFLRAIHGTVTNLWQYLMISKVITGLSFESEELARAINNTLESSIRHNNTFDIDHSEIKLFSKKILSSFCYCWLLSQQSLCLEWSSWKNSQKGDFCCFIWKEKNSIYIKKWNRITILLFDFYSINKYVSFLLLCYIRVYLLLNAIHREKKK